MIEQLQQLSDQHELGLSFEVRKIVTKGDRIVDVMLSKVGGKGLFVKEIEQALLDREIDLAVHSMKDMPHTLQEGLMNGAVPTRVDARDCLVTRNGLGFLDLPHGAKVGTSSLRRSCQLKHARPDLQLEWIRGNIDSRIRKLETEGFDAIVLATAGLTRMGWLDRISDYIPVDLCIPAVGQGALGIECREDDEQVRHLLSLYNDPVSSLTVAAERSFLGTLNGGCQVPIGAHAVMKDAHTISLIGVVGTPDGTVLLKEAAEGTDAAALGIQVAEALCNRGADEILAQVRG